MRTPPVKSINTVAKRFVGRSELVLQRKSIRESLVSLAGLIGKPVKYQGGREIGRLVDVVVRHGEDSYPPVSGLIVKVGQSKSFIDGARISKLAQNEIELSSAKVDLTEFTRREGESLLDTDVLDHQIVDVNGLRVVRSSDLYLAPLDREIRVVGVDISFKAFIRRIFPGALGRGPIPKHVIDWANVASLAHGTGVVRSTESRAALGQLRPADLADLIEDLAGRERNALIEMLDPDLAADALEEMEDEELQGLLRGLSAQRSAELISRMEPDEGAEVLRDLDDDHRESIFMEMDVSVAKQLRKLVEFDETLAGGIMTSHMLITHEDDTVASALALLVKHKSRDISDGIVVVDARGKLLDHIQIIELIAAKPSAKLSSLMGPPYPTTVNLNTRLDEVIDEFANNRGSSIIVVDEKNKPVGRILADDLVDALASTSDTQGFSQGSGAL
ncbi:MAG: CBS domain-containing protein [Actinobacteria bacterium]|nr:CBS domain-containing protein [Actinomycetota bacterium]MDA2981792.1 CBS domain-containing protein [Actinomycetota bacterium]MDA2996691.1 CBS domain-containing protein [Actinomycetota bacterium]